MTLLQNKTCDLVQGMVESLSVGLESNTAGEQSNEIRSDLQSTPMTPPQINSVDIVQQGTTYHVSIDLDTFSPFVEKDRAFLIWLYKRNAKETVYLTLVNVFPPTDFYIWFNGYASLFQAIISCKAEVIGVVDGPVFSIDAYVFMACHKLYFGHYAVVTVVPVWSGGSRRPSTEESVQSAFVHTLYARAVELQLLTEDEVTTLVNGQAVSVLTSDFQHSSYENIRAL